jgi:hypothetical protein
MTKARDIASAAPAPSTVSATELGYLDGVTSALQTQINSKIGQSTAINPTIVDAKGDIIAASAADTVARLAVGANDTVLTADSSTGTGLKWAAPTAGGYTLINTGGTTLSGSSVTISSIPTTYRILKIVTVNFGTSGAAYAGIEANGANNLFFGKEHVSVGAGGFGTQVVNGGIIQYSGFQDITANATANNQAITEITNYASSTQNKQVAHFGTFVGGGNINTVMWMGELRTTSAITSLEFWTNSSFNAGTVYVYGA